MRVFDSVYFQQLSLLNNLTTFYLFTLFFRLWMKFVGACAYTRTEEQNKIRHVFDFSVADTFRFVEFICYFRYLSCWFRADIIHNFVLSLSRSIFRQITTFFFLQKYDNIQIEKNREEFFENTNQRGFEKKDEENEIKKKRLQLLNFNVNHQPSVISCVSLFASVIIINWVTSCDIHLFSGKKKHSCVFFCKFINSRKNSIWFISFVSRNQFIGLYFVISLHSNHTMQSI